jgi:hypothetical protein
VIVTAPVVVTVKEFPELLAWSTVPSNDSVVVTGLDAVGVDEFDPQPAAMMALAASDPSHSCLMIESLYMSETFVSSELTRPRKNGTATRAHRRRAISASREIVCVFCHGFATDSPHFAVSKIGRECRTGATTPHRKASAIDREPRESRDFEDAFAGTCVA